MNKKAVLYARVSSKEQEKEGFSIPAQLKLLREYAAGHGITIVKEYVDAETAKRVGRTGFQLMLEEISQGLASMILVEKTDRLTRNFKDYVAIDDLIQSKGLEVHLVKEGEVLGPNAKSHTKLMHGLKVVLAKNYIDNLSEEIKKGIHEKAEQGWFPHQPPYGYKAQNKKIVIVPEKARFVQRLYELYATGKYTFETIPNALYEEGFAYLPSTPKIPKQTVEKLLKNPFYKGLYTFGGKTYRGNHELFLPAGLVQAVESVLSKRGHKHVEKSLLFQGLITCGYCGCCVVGEVKKGKYTYYHCSNGKKACKREYVREERVEEAVLYVLQSIQPTEEQYQWLHSILKHSHEEQEVFHEESVARLQKDLKLVDRKLDRIYDDYLEGLLDEAAYRRRRKDLLERQQQINLQQERHQKAKVSYQEQGLVIVELAKNASGFYLQQSYEGKRDLLKILLSNFTLEGKAIKPELHFAFASFVKVLEKENLVEPERFELSSRTYAGKHLRA